MHETAMLPSSPPSAPQPVAISGSSQDVAFIAEPASVAAAGDPTGRGEAKNWNVDWKPVLLLVLLLVVLYHGIALKLVDDWYELPDFSHGFLIPFFAAFLLWDKREQLRSTPIAPSWAGVSLVAAGLIALLLGVLGADLFFQRTSFVVLVAGLVWTLLGKKMLGQLKFVLFVLLLAIPLPAIIYNQITFPLQMWASSLSSRLLQVVGVPVLQMGNIIRLPAMDLEVAEACSGIRSLMSLFTVAVIYGYFLERETWRRVLLALSSIPIAVTANVLRIFGTGLCVQYWDPEKAMGFFHEFSGWLVFLVSLGCLYLVHLSMRMFAGKGRSLA